MPIALRRFKFLAKYPYMGWVYLSPQELYLNKVNPFSQGCFVSNINAFQHMVNMKKVIPHSPYFVLFLGRKQGPVL